MAKTATRGKVQRRVAASASPLFSPGSSATAAASTLSEKVYRAFKRDIIHSVYQPGEALSEKALADRYKGSRTPVREAAVRLQNERLLRIVPNRGYFVAQITLQVLNDIRVGSWVKLGCPDPDKALPASPPRLDARSLQAMHLSGQFQMALLEAVK